MIKKENKKIDSLLTRFYREEAKNIETPDSLHSWQKFQQKLEEAGGKEADFPIPEPPVPTDHKNTSFLFGFFGKYRNLTVLAAACLLVVMVLSGMPPAQSLRQFFLTGSQPKTDMIVTEEMQEEPLLMPEQKGQQYKAFNQERALLGEEDAESFSIMQQQEEPLPPAAHPPLSLEDSARRDAAPAGAGEMGDFSPGVAIFADAGELAFNTLEQYCNALHEHSGMAPGKLFYLAEPPEGYSFSMGCITKTDTDIKGVRQEFTGISGDKLIVQQMFTAPVITSDEPVAEHDEKLSPDSLGEPGYEFHMQDDFNTLQLSRVESIVTLYGQLDEDGLLTISEKLTSLE